MAEAECKGWGLCGRYCGGRGGILPRRHKKLPIWRCGRCAPVEKFTGRMVYASHITLASRGLEEPAHASRGLEEPFFQLCCCVSFRFWREIGFGYILGTYVLRVSYNTVVVLC